MNAMIAAAAKKTFKREVAIAILIYLAVIIMMAADQQPVETLKIIIWPAMIYVFQAFGMEWVSKQTNLVK